MRSVLKALGVVLCFGSGCSGKQSGATGGDSVDGDAATAGDPGLLEITPLEPTLTVTTGAALPTVQFVATVGGTQVAAAWLCDRQEIGALDAQGLFTPTGEVAGEARVTATVATESISTRVTVRLELLQNGASASDPPAGSTAWGGIGGEGVGPAASSGLEAALLGPTSPDPQMRWLYPYDRTVWPLGLLPPLLQWNAGVGAVADGVYVHVWSAHFDYRGTFARPAALAGGEPFVRHPIPPAAWQAATLSSAGSTLNVELVVVAGGVAYGPIAQIWTIARGTLKGVVHYQAAGTQLVRNHAGAMGGDGRFGGAVMALEPGASLPTVAAGREGAVADCRGCHSVSADGSRLVAQHGDASAHSSSFVPNNGYAETDYAAATDGNLGWVGMSPDGSKGLGNRAPLPGGANPDGPQSSLFDMVDGTLLPATGLSSMVTRAGFPAFSVDGQHVAFNFYAGAGNGEIGPGNGTKLVGMEFDEASDTFSNASLLYEGAMPAWPSFLPTNDALVFQVVLPGAAEMFATRYGGRGEIWWSDLATGNAVALNELNGASYLPTGPDNHGDDTVLNYQPNVGPIPSGGYAWVCFTSRRLYGNVATIDPWASDPREHDLTAHVTPKKIWVAAIDLGASPGTDPSHPAFYLPGQELLSPNGRPTWSQTPCRADGAACGSGDECCGGYCRSGVCQSASSGCSLEYERCAGAADCCGSMLTCLNGMCLQPAPG